MPDVRLQDELKRAKIEQARRMHPMQRLLAGPALFDLAAAMTLSGIRHQHPGISHDDAIRVLRDRLDRRERREATEHHP